jgi:hypothetical protein
MMEKQEQEVPLIQENHKEEENDAKVECESNSKRFKGPRSGYIIFLQDNYALFKAENHELSNRGIIQ